jgi:hypothetical protein
MDDSVSLGDGIFELGEVSDNIGFDEREFGAKIAFEKTNIDVRALPRKVVENDHMLTFDQEMTSQIDAYKPCSAGNEYILVFLGIRSLRRSFLGHKANNTPIYSNKKSAVSKETGLVMFDKILEQFFTSVR